MNDIYTLRQAGWLRTFWVLSESGCQPCTPKKSYFFAEKYSNSLIGEEKMREREGMSKGRRTSCSDVFFYFQTCSVHPISCPMARLRSATEWIAPKPYPFI